MVDFDRTIDGLSRRELVRGAAGFATTAALVGPLAACGEREPGPRAGGVARFAITAVGANDNLDPVFPSSANASYYVSAIFDTLTDMDDEFNVRPHLAKSFEASDDLTVWTFHLRRGVRFHDGEPLTARDAVYSVKRMLVEENASPWYGHLAPLLDEDGVQAPDQHTLVLNLNKPSNIVPQLLASYASSIYREGTEDFRTTANGTGPFKLTSFRPGESWEVEKNPDYWLRGRPHLDGIRGFRADGTQKVQAAIAGEVDVTDAIDFSLAGSVEGGGSAELLIQPARYQQRVVMDVTKAPFDDERVRMAVKLAQDREVIADTAFGGYAVLTSDTAAPSDAPSYPPDLGVRKQDIAEARRLLEAAGHGGGLDLELYAAPVTGGNVDMAVAFAKVVEPAGIRVKLRQASADTFWSEVWQKKACYAQYEVRLPPAIFLQLYHTKEAAWNETKLAANQHSPVDRLVEQAVQTSNEERQLAKFQEAHRWIADHEGTAVAAFSNGLFAKAKKVANAQLQPLGGFRWREMSLEV